MIETQAVGIQTEPEPYRVLPGRAHPLGATPDAYGVNFALYCGHATGVELLLFDATGQGLVQVIALDPLRNHSFMFWHVYVVGLRPGTRYAFRVDGPFDPHGSGDRYDRQKVLIDPYARVTMLDRWNRLRAAGAGSNLASAMQSVVIDLQDYDWEGDQPLHLPLTETVIYEMHVRGFTRSPTSGVAHPGTFAGVVEKIPYLQRLGITAVELLPVCQFDPQEPHGANPFDGSLLVNYWGYNTVSFFSPHHAYCVTPTAATHIREFRDMVKALHRAGIEVILDMVFNHTSEGDEHGPVIHFKGLANSTYYYLDPADRARYLDFTGCINTVNCNHPVVAKLITDCLEFWVRDMHVDGFRFDEGSVLSRGEDGHPMQHPPVVWSIELSDVLADVKVIAEAWDAAGLYQVGEFPGRRWAQWNGLFRDDVRRFVRGDPGLVGRIASRLAGSSDIFHPGTALPINSVNFITCHDGFTLHDLVSYNRKHNLSNGERNRDGLNENFSWNCGQEGPSSDPAVEALRLHQIKNFAAILLLAQGVPMLLAGDEARRTQRGNNNAYCHDNALSWFNWTLVEENADLVLFFSRLIAFRRRHRSLRRGFFFTGLPNGRGVRDIVWYDHRLHTPDWNDPEGHELACTIGATEDDTTLHIMLNMHEADQAFLLPPLERQQWFKAVDTAAPTRLGVPLPGQEPVVAGTSLVVAARSVVVLIAAGS